MERSSQHQERHKAGGLGCGVGVIPALFDPNPVSILLELEENIIDTLKNAEEALNEKFEVTIQLLCNTEKAGQFPRFDPSMERASQLPGLKSSMDEAGQLPGLEQSMDPARQLPLCEQSMKVGEEVRLPVRYKDFKELLQLQSGSGHIEELASFAPNPVAQLLELKNYLVDTLSNTEKALEEKFEIADRLLYDMQRARQKKKK